MKGYKKTTEQFISESISSWGEDLFDYSSVDYVNDKTYVKLKCLKHNHVFKQTPSNHLEFKKGCKHCIEEQKLELKKKQGLVMFEKANTIHDSKYDYTHDTYLNNSAKFNIYCKSCKTKFPLTFKSHLKGSGCPICTKKKRKSTTKKRDIPFFTKLSREEVIKSFKEVHGNKYSYDKFIYKASKEKAIITCKKHGDFSQTPSDHKNGAGCKECSIEENRKKFAKTTEEFIKESEVIHCHNNEPIYNYQLTEYVNNRTKVKIICNKLGHGVFLKTPDKHLQGQGCPICAKEQNSINRRLKKADILKKFKKIHGDLFSYEKVDYQGIDTPIKIICKTHTDFEITPGAHLLGQGCPKCSSTKGERMIGKVLTDLNLDYEIEKTFDDLVFKNKLRFDFYIKELNLLIEYDGQQHFTPVKFGGISFERATELYINSKKRDLIKNKYAKINSFNLLRIPYWDFKDIETILTKYIKGL